MNWRKVDIDCPTAPSEAHVISNVGPSLQPKVRSSVCTDALDLAIDKPLNFHRIHQRPAALSKPTNTAKTSTVSSPDKSQKTPLKKPKQEQVRINVELQHLRPTSKQSTLQLMIRLCRLPDELILMILKKLPAAWLEQMFKHLPVTEIKYRKFHSFFDLSLPHYEVLDLSNPLKRRRLFQDIAAMNPEKDPSDIWIDMLCDGRLSEDGVPLLHNYTKVIRMPGFQVRIPERVVTSCASENGAIPDKCRMKKRFKSKSVDTSTATASKDSQTGPSDNKSNNTVAVSDANISKPKPPVIMKQRKSPVVSILHQRIMRRILVYCGHNLTILNLNNSITVNLIPCIWQMLAQTCPQLIDLQMSRFLPPYEKRILEKVADTKSDHQPVDYRWKVHTEKRGLELLLNECHSLQRLNISWIRTNPKIGGSGLRVEDIIGMAMALAPALRYVDCRCCDSRWQECPEETIKAWYGIDLVPEQYMARISTRNRINERMTIVCSHN